MPYLEHWQWYHLFPMLSVLFGQTKKVYIEPVWSGFSNAREYAEQHLNFFITQKAEQGVEDVLFFMVALVISMFFLKNVFRYLAMYSITFLRNGVLKDLRNALYNKTLTLPISYYSEKRKGDTIARITSDVLEIQHSFLVDTGTYCKGTANHNLYHISNACYKP